MRCEQRSSRRTRLLPAIPLLGGSLIAGQAAAQDSGAPLNFLPEDFDRFLQIFGS